MADFFTNVAATYGAPHAASDFMAAWNKGVDTGKTNHLNSLLASGNLDDAQHQALSDGNFDYYNHVQTLKSTNAAEAQKHVDLVARAAHTLKSVPLEQRQSVFDSVYRPQLQQLGVPDASLSHADLSDAGLQGYESAAMTLTQQQERDDKVGDRHKPMIAGDHLYAAGLTSEGQYDGTAKEVGGRRLKQQTIKLPDGSDGIVFVNEDTGDVYDPRGSQISSGSAPSPAGGGARAVGNGDGGGFEAAMKFTLPHEGSKAVIDSNGAVVKYGINQAFHPEVDVRNLDENGARGVYQKLWDESGAAKLPTGLQTAYFDTYIMSTARAKKMLAQYGNDPEAFLQARQTYQDRLAQSPKYARYKHAWDTRTADLGGTIGQAQPDAPAQPEGVQVASNTPLTMGDMPAPAQDAPASAPAQVAENDPTQGLKPHVFGQAAPWKTYTTPAGDTIRMGPTGKPELLVRHDKPDTMGGLGGLQPLDAATARNYAWQSLITGTPPRTGGGKIGAVNNQLIMQAQTQILGENGLGPTEAPKLKAKFASSAANLKNTTARLSNYSTAVDALAQTADQYLKTAKALPYQTNIRGLNHVINYALGQTGNPELAKLETNVQAIGSEFGRLNIGSPTGAGVLSDSARQEAISTLHSDAPYSAKKAAVEQILVDGRIRQKAALHARDAAMSDFDRWSNGAPITQAHGPSSSSAPKPSLHVGQVVNGHTYRGGNPRDPKSWQ